MTSLQVVARILSYAYVSETYSNVLVYECMSLYAALCRMECTLLDLCNVLFLNRLDGLMPEGVEISNNSFAFTRPLERNDSGVYRCEVLNDIGLRSQDVNLWVQGMFILLHSVS